MSSREEFETHIVDVPSSSPSSYSDYDDASDDALKFKHNSSPNLQQVNELQPDKKCHKAEPKSMVIQECRSVDAYEILNKIEEGSYGIVYKAILKETKQVFALKRLKMGKQTDGFPITSIREIITLLMSQHKNIINVKELVLGHDVTKIYIVMEYVEHDLRSLMKLLKNKGRQFSIGEIKCLVIQIIEGVKCLHENWIIHRDLKPSNILIGNDAILKIADFGLCRLYGSPLKQFSPIVVTLYYRSVELLLGIRKYSTFVDIWSIGCIMSEFYLMRPLWECKSEQEMLNGIFKDLGLISEAHYPQISTECRHYGTIEKGLSKDLTGKNCLKLRFDSRLSEKGLALLKEFFNYNPTERISANKALESIYFKESPQAIDPSLFPSWPEKNKPESTLGEKKSTPGPPKNHKMQPDADSVFF